MAPHGSYYSRLKETSRNEEAEAESNLVSLAEALFDAPLPITETELGRFQTVSQDFYFEVSSDDPFDPSRYLKITKYWRWSYDKTYLEIAYGYTLMKGNDNKVDQSGSLSGSQVNELLKTKLDSLNVPPSAKVIDSHTYRASSGIQSLTGLTRNRIDGLCRK